MWLLCGKRLRALLGCCLEASRGTRSDVTGGAIEGHHSGTQRMPDGCPFAHDAICMIIHDRQRNFQKVPLSCVGLCIACDGSWLRIPHRACVVWPSFHGPSCVTSLTTGNSDVCLFALCWSLALSPQPLTSLPHLPLLLYINTLTRLPFASSITQ